MKLFVTGATGFLGRHVVRAALDAGAEVRAMIRDPRLPLPEGAEPVRTDLYDVEGLSGALRGLDAVLHLAGQVSRDRQRAAELHQIHVEGTRALLAAMKRAGVGKLVVASTSGTVGLRSVRGRRPATESDQPDFELLGRFPYYTSKLYQEREVMRRVEDGQLEAVILNPSLLLGPGDQRMSSTEDVLEILNRRVPAASEGTMAMVDVRDVAPVFVAALERGRSGERYLLNGANMSVRSFVQRVGVAGDVLAPTLRVPAKWAVRGSRWLSGVMRTFDLDPPLDPMAVEMSTLHWDVDASKAQRELGFVARDPQLTIEATVQDLEATGRFRRRA